jgi:hypothetical protein
MFRFWCSNARSWVSFVCFCTFCFRPFIHSFVRYCCLLDEENMLSFFVANDFLCVTIVDIHCYYRFFSTVTILDYHILVKVVVMSTVISPDTWELVVLKMTAQRTVSMLLRIIDWAGMIFNLVRQIL